MPEMTVEEKRAAAIKKKEEERQRKNEEIKAQKAAAAADREKDRMTKTELEEKKKQEAAELQAKRDANIAKKEAERAAKGAEASGKPKQKSKYAKSDVMLLKQVFDDYDDDKSGTLALSELKGVMNKRHDELTRNTGKKKTLAERNAAQGISIRDLVEPIFNSVDANGDGTVSFDELLKLIYPLATEKEFQTMLEWVAPEPEPEPEPLPELSPEQMEEINAIFKLYDKDKSGKLEIKELREALGNTGMDRDEIQELFKQCDVDNSGTISKDEWLVLMKTSGMYGDVA